MKEGSKLDSCIKCNRSDAHGQTTVILISGLANPLKNVFMVTLLYVFLSL